MIRSLFLPLLLLACFPLAAQNRTEAARQQLEKALDALQQSPGVRNGTVAVAIGPAKGGGLLVERRATQCVVPASTLKLVTTASALAILGESFRFETTLEYDGRLQNGVLNGNLYLRGTGDPTLGTSRFTGFPDLSTLFGQWATRIKEIGIREVTGRLVADAGLFDENALPPGWVWGDIGNYYGSAAYALNCNENLYRVVFRPGKKVGDPASVLRTEPEVPGLEQVNTVRTGPPGSGDQVYIFGGPYAQSRYMEGTVPAGVSEFVVKGALPDPPLFCAQTLHHRLAELGIPVRGGYSTDRLLRNQGVALSGTRTILFNHLSPPLRDIIAQTNFQSINLYAEALLKAVAVRSGKPGTTKGGVEAVREYWQKRGINTDGFFIKDGSGLSPGNCLTTTQLVSILRLTAQDPAAFPAYYASIPIVGASGTVKNLAKGTAAAGNVRAKSGTTERVKSYAGYYTAPSGQLVVFAVVVNNFDNAGGAVTQQLENILGLMAKVE